MKYTLKEWTEEAKKKFGDDISNWKFVCPACGHINVGAEFRELGIEPNSLYSECIGRYKGKGSAVKGDNSGCNWAAYGLLGTLGKGNKVLIEEGKEVEVFAFGEDKSK